MNFPVTRHSTSAIKYVQPTIDRHLAIILAFEISHYLQLNCISVKNYVKELSSSVTISNYLKLEL